jgi:hypothetical protein
VTSVEEQICQRVHEFDIQALLELVYYLGYRPEDVLFKSNFSTLSQPSLIEEIQFCSQPIRHVVITLNLGLLSVLSPLPSYFMRAIENTNLDEKALLDFLEFFNHKLIQSYLYSIYPEYNSRFYSDWESTKKGYLRLLGLDSVTFLHHLFQMVFPELGIAVEKSRHKRQLTLGAFRLGESILGDTKVLGSQATVPVIGFDITLYCDEEFSDRRTTWADKIAQRLHKLLFPILQELDICLKIVLIIRTQKSWLQLKKGSYLGIDKLQGGAEKNRMVLVFKGLVTAES